MTLEEAIERSDKMVRDVDYKIDGLPEMATVLYLISSLNFEITTGGVEQWLVNSTGGYATETRDALRTVGAQSIASLVDEIIQTFPEKSIPRNDIERAKLVTRCSAILASKWREIGDRILNWPDDIDALLRQYVLKLPDTPAY